MSTFAIQKAQIKKEIAGVKKLLTKVANWSVSSTTNDYSDFVEFDVAGPNDPFFNGKVVAQRNGNVTASIDFLDSLKNNSDQLTIIANKMFDLLGFLQGASEEDTVNVNEALEKYNNYVVEFNSIMNFKTMSQMPYLTNQVQPGINSITFDPTSNEPVDPKTTFLYYNNGINYLPYNPALTPSEVNFATPYVLLPNDTNVAPTTDTIDLIDYTSGATVTCNNSSVNVNPSSNPYVTNAINVNNSYVPPIRPTFFMQAGNPITSSTGVTGNYKTNISTNLGGTTGFTANYRNNIPTTLYFGSNTPSVYLYLFFWKGNYYKYQYDQTTLQSGVNGGNFISFNAGAYVDASSDYQLVITDSEGNLGVLQQADTDLSLFYKAYDTSGNVVVDSNSQPIVYNIDTQVYINKTTYVLLNGNIYTVSGAASNGTSGELKQVDSSALNFVFIQRNKTQYVAPVNAPAGNINPQFDSGIKLYNNWYVVSNDNQPIQKYYIYNGILYIFSNENYNEDYSIALRETNTQYLFNVSLTPNADDYLVSVAQQKSTLEKIKLYLQFKEEFADQGIIFLKQLESLNNTELLTYAKNISDLKELKASELDNKILNLEAALEILN